MSNPVGESCLNCKFWAVQTTTLSIDPKGIGNKPISVPGTKPNTDWGLCRARSVGALAFQTGSWAWGICHQTDWCGEWG